MRFFRHRNLWLTPSQKARLQHQRWLNRAMAGDTRALRIPVRRVDEGGFNHLRTIPGGRQWAEHWWTEAIDRADIFGTR